ncbi:MAG: ribosome recycling factor [Candidatus Babeliaceae bacterium]
MTKFLFTETTNTKPFEKAVEAEMDNHIKHFDKELIKIRTGRAHPSMVEDLKIAHFGEIMPLKHIGAISAPDPQLLIIQPWDISLIPDIEKAIAQSDLGVTPANDGNVIRIQLPRMSGARRDELAKVLAKKVEECRISLRNVRKDFHNDIREAEKTKKISEDTSRRLQDVLQKITDRFVELADKMGHKKEEEIRLL